jgi:phosphatidylglycerophosphate synthase
MANPPWDQRVARVLVKPLVKTPVTPNQLTVLTLLVALAGAGLLAHGGAAAANWGAGIFALARFMDHFDGELARQKGMTSRLGYYLDYISGALSYGALFLCIGVGLRDSGLGQWAIALGAVGAFASAISMFANLDIDKHAKEPAEAGKDAVGYPAFAGFELEDGIYLIAPITWLGFLQPFFVLAGIGSAVYCLWTVRTSVRLRRG